MSEVNDKDRCATCKYWRAESTNSLLGSCNRYPPSAFSVLQMLVSDHWCGEFRSDIAQMKLWESKR